MRNVSKKLRAVREKLGLSQNQVAETVGISRGKMINIEKGESNIDIALLDCLAHLYGHSLEYFLQDDEEEYEVSLAFRSTTLNEADAFINAWGSRILMNMRNLDEILGE